MSEPSSNSFTVSCRCQSCAQNIKYTVDCTIDRDDRPPVVCEHCNYVQQKVKSNGIPSIGYSYNTRKMSDNMKDRFREIAKELPESAKGNITQHI